MQVVPRIPALPPYRSGLIPFASMLSSLSYAILALLAGKPQSGYDLARQMKPPLGMLWQAKHGQIYPELARLVASGFVDFERIDKRSGPPRRVHSITAKGRAELAGWVLESPQPRAMNDELVVKAYAIRRVPRRHAMAMLQAQIDLHQSRLAALEVMAQALNSRSSASVRVDSVRFGEYAAIRRAIGAEREYVAWCMWLTNELAPDKHSIAPTAGRRAAPKRSGVARERHHSAVG